MNENQISTIFQIRGGCTSLQQLLYLSSPSVASQFSDIKGEKALVSYDDVNLAVTKRSFKMSV